MGAYASTEARYLHRLTLRLLRYDNRADDRTDTLANTIAWDSRCTRARRGAENGDGWTGIVQGLRGRVRNCRCATASKPRGADR